MTKQKRCDMCSEYSFNTFNVCEPDDSVAGTLFVCGVCARQIAQTAGLPGPESADEVLTTNENDTGASNE